MFQGRLENMQLTRFKIIQIYQIQGRSDLELIKALVKRASKNSLAIKEQ